MPFVKPKDSNGTREFAADRAAFSSCLPEPEPRTCVSFPFSNRRFSNNRVLKQSNFKQRGRRGDARILGSKQKARLPKQAGFYHERNFIVRV
jgi:hypothetical protein